MSDRRLTYLAAPYSHPLPEVRQDRAHRISRAHARLVRDGHLVYSPICHTHSIATHREYRIPYDWEHWRDSCLAFLSICGRVLVLQLDGWERSVGVAAEIVIATEQGLSIDYKTEQELHG